MSPRVLIPIFGLIALMGAVSNMVFGLAFWEARSTAFACALFGTAVVSCAWHTSAEACQKQPMAMMARFSYSISGGVAVYFNLAWLLWGLGVPVGLRFLNEAQAVHAQWIGPSVLAYAGLCYLVMRLSRGRSSTGQEGLVVPSTQYPDESCMKRR